jgi:hypothetical protein
MYANQNRISRLPSGIPGVPGHNLPLNATTREHFRQTLNEDSLSSSCGTSQDRHGPVLERDVEIRDVKPVNPDSGLRIAVAR